MARVLPGPRAGIVGFAVRNFPGAAGMVASALIALTALLGCGTVSQPGTSSQAATGTSPMTASGVSNRAPRQPIVHPSRHAADSPERELRVKVGDPDGDRLDVAFYGRTVHAAANGTFSIAVLPDTQFYSEEYPDQFKAQTKWIVENRRDLNIAYVVHVGDVVQSANEAYQWHNADAAMSALEDPFTTMLRDGLPYGIAPGNHDQWPLGDPDGDSTRLYNHYFGVNRFIGRSYYGDHYGAHNDNHYDLFSAAGLDFVVLYFEYDTTMDEPILRWADKVLKTYSNRHAILVSHYLMEVGEQSPFGPQGMAIYNFLKSNPNLFLMLCGHMHGEGRRTDVAMPSGNTVHTILADYQDRTNGGDGWLRLLEFAPAHNTIRVTTYSPTLDRFETDADSRFSFNHDMSGGSPFAELELLHDVPGDGEVAIGWRNLSSDATHQWYVTVSDGKAVTKSPVWTFTGHGAQRDQ